MDIKQIQQKIRKDLKVDLTDEFDRNFERKGFFDRKWPQTKSPNSKGSLMMRSGDLRKSITVKEENNTIRWASSLLYASLHNEGGTIKVTAQMKKFFWAMYYKNAGAITHNKKGMAKTKRNERLSGEAVRWKAMALMKTGTEIKIQERRFIGFEHPMVKQRIQTVVNLNMELLEKFIKNSLNPRRKK